MITRQNEFEPYQLAARKKSAEMFQRLIGDLQAVLDDPNTPANGHQATEVMLTFIRADLAQMSNLQDGMIINEN